MSLVTRTAALLFAVAVAAPALAAPDLATITTVRAEDAPAEYAVEVEAAPLRVGVNGFAIVRIKAMGGYHWNKEYPAKAAVTNGELKTVDVNKREFKQLAGEFETSETLATVKIPVTGKAAGRETLKVETRFSVCTDKICLIKKASADVALVVTP